VLKDLGANVIADSIVVPHRPAEQVLQPVGLELPAGSAIVQPFLAWQVRQQSEHERPGAPSRRHAGEPTRDPAQQLVQPYLASGRRYAVAYGQRLVVGCPSHQMINGGRPVCSPGSTRFPTSQVTIYGWSTSALRSIKNKTWKASPGPADRDRRPPRRPPAPTVRGAVGFDQVSFAYAPGLRPALAAVAQLSP
jgi:hypothetical protein